jgi:hypothetical protein
MRYLLAAFIIGTPLLSACEMYEMQPASDGEVYVLNKYTGTLQRSEDGRLGGVERTPPLIRGDCSFDYGHLGMRFSGSYRAIGPTVYYRLEIAPSAPSGRTISVENWLAYFEEKRTYGGANFELQSYDGFKLADARLGFSDAIGIVDTNGQRSGFTVQGTASLAAGVVNEIGLCLIGFYGLSPIPPQHLDPIAGSAPVERE